MYIWLDNDRYPIISYDVSDNQLKAMYKGEYPQGVDLDKLLSTQSINAVKIEDEGEITEYSYVNCEANTALKETVCMYEIIIF